MNKQEHRLSQIIMKIEVFSGLDLGEVQRILNLCSPQKYASNETVFEEGENSEDMIILLSGKLKVIGKSGEELSELSPGTAIGEMGILTGHSRSATVVSSTPSSGLKIGREPLKRLLDGDVGLRAKILSNMVDGLCQRLIEANEHIEQFAKESQIDQEAEEALA